MFFLGQTTTCLIVSSYLLLPELCKVFPALSWPFILEVAFRSLFTQTRDSGLFAIAARLVAPSAVTSLSPLLISRRLAFIFQNRVGLTTFWPTLQVVTSSFSFSYRILS